MRLVQLGTVLQQKAANLTNSMIRSGAGMPRGARAVGLYISTPFVATNDSTAYNATESDLMSVMQNLYGSFATYWNTAGNLIQVDGVSGGGLTAWQARELLFFAAQADYTVQKGTAQPYRLQDVTSSNAQVAATGTTTTLNMGFYRPYRVKRLGVEDQDLFLPGKTQVDTLRVDCTSGTSLSINSGHVTNNGDVTATVYADITEGPDTWAEVVQYTYVQSASNGLENIGPSNQAILGILERSAAAGATALTRFSIFREAANGTPLPPIHNNMLALEVIRMREVEAFPAGGIDMAIHGGGTNSSASVAGITPLYELPWGHRFKEAPVQMRIALNQVAADVSTLSVGWIGINCKTAERIASLKPHFNDPKVGVPAVIATHYNPSGVDFDAPHAAALAMRLDKPGDERYGLEHGTMFDVGEAVTSTYTPEHEKQAFQAQIGSVADAHSAKAAAVLARRAAIQIPGATDAGGTLKAQALVALRQLAGSNTALEAGARAHIGNLVKHAHV